MSLEENEEPYKRAQLFDVCWWLGSSDFPKAFGVHFYKNFYLFILFNSFGRKQETEIDHRFCCKQAFSRVDAQISETKFFKNSFKMG
jgi:hypothetical protein